MKGIKKQHRSEMSSQINSQGPLSNLPCLHVADESNMAAEMAELEICRYPGNARSKVWEYLGFYQVKEGPKTKENLDMTKVICRLCRTQCANKGLWHVCFVDFVSVSWNAYWYIFLIIIDDRLVGAIRLFPMIDCEISTDSHHYLEVKLVCMFLYVALSHNHTKIPRTFFTYLLLLNKAKVREKCLPLNVEMHNSNFLDDKLLLYFGKKFQC